MKQKQKCTTLKKKRIIVKSCILFKILNCVQNGLLIRLCHEVSLVFSLCGSLHHLMSKLIPSLNSFNKPYRIICPWKTCEQTTFKFLYLVELLVCFNIWSVNHHYVMKNVEMQRYHGTILMYCLVCTLPLDEMKWNFNHICVVCLFTLERIVHKFLSFVRTTICCF